MKPDKEKKSDQKAPFGNLSGLASGVRRGMQSSTPKPASRHAVIPPSQIASSGLVSVSTPMEYPFTVLRAGNRTLNPSDMAGRR
jgi:hypothetical protein